MKLRWPRLFLVLFAGVAIPIAYYFTGVVGAIVVTLLCILRWIMSCVFYDLVVRRTREALRDLSPEEREEQLSRLEPALRRDIEQASRPIGNKATRSLS